jgi:hypothetical protein
MTAEIVYNKRKCVRKITHHLSGLIFITMAVASVCQAKQSKLK